jgi:hypothetical protein
LRVLGVGQSLVHNGFVDVVLLSGDQPSEQRNARVNGADDADRCRTDSRFQGPEARADHLAKLFVCAHEGRLFANHAFAKEYALLDLCQVPQVIKVLRLVDHVQRLAMLLQEVFEVGWIVRVVEVTTNLIPDSTAQRLKVLWGLPKTIDEDLH